MDKLSQASGYWGPDSCAAAISITFDNLGEAAELERGTWPRDIALGQHFSVIHVLPRILKMLDNLNLCATFFVEGLNTQLYPRAMIGIRAAGHEIGYHGWRHEEWQPLEYEEEAHILECGMSAMDKLGIKPYGFRPPGGVLTNSSVKLLKNMGFTYCSPAGSITCISAGLAILPFEWPIVDAYAYLPRFGGLRERFGDAYDPLPSTSFRARLHFAVSKVVQNRSYLALLFHPFVEEREEYFAVMQATLKEIYALVHAGTIWCASCHEIAAWMLNHPADFVTVPSL